MYSISCTCTCTLLIVIILLFLALQAKVDPNIKRYPTDKFAGVFLSSSMPQQPKEPPIVSNYNVLISTEEPLFD